MAEIFKDDITIIDERGFHHTVTVKHHPDVGVSIAYYRELRISQREYGRHLPPRSDDDQEWEEYQMKFYEGIGGDVLSFFETECKQIINNQQ